jgi:hypothetical protein
LRRWTAQRRAAPPPHLTGKARHLLPVIDTGRWIVLGQQEVDGKSNEPELHT